MVRVQCHDVMITNEIGLNLFGLARVEDAKKIYRVRDHSIMILDEDQNIFLVTSVIHNLKKQTNSSENLL